MMKAVVYHGQGDIRFEDVDEPKILDDRDAILQLTASGTGVIFLTLFVW